MVLLDKNYIRRKDMDSVLKSMIDDINFVDSSMNFKLKSIVQHDYFSFFKSFSDILINILRYEVKEQKGSIIMSPLTPLSIFNLVTDLGYTPLFIDVELDSGCLDQELIKNSNTEDVVALFNYLPFGLDNILDSQDYSFPIISFFEGGLVYSNNLSSYSIYFLDENTLIPMGGGYLLAHNNQEYLNVTKKLEISCAEIFLSKLNISYGIEKLNDIDELYTKKNKIVRLYKESILKSGYKTLETKEIDTYSYFPVVITKGLGDTEKYFKQNNIQTNRAFSNSYMASFKIKKYRNGYNLCHKCLLIPVNLGIIKSSVELITKVLSTMP